MSEYTAKDFKKGQPFVTRELIDAFTKLLEE